MKISISENEYIDHYYNGTINNERALEIQFGIRYLLEFTDVIEIGAVMPYYGYDSHLIYDPYDSHPKNIKEFAENLDIKNKNILSISTIEHMGETNGHGYCFTAQKPDAPAEFLEKLLEQAKSFLITLPIGQNPPLDNYLKNNLNKYTWLGFEKLSQSPPLWKSNNTLKIYEKTYGYPFPASNALIILTKGINYE